MSPAVPVPSSPANAHAPVNSPKLQPLAPTGVSRLHRFSPLLVSASALLFASCAALPGATSEHTLAATDSTDAAAWRLAPLAAGQDVVTQDNATQLPAEIGAEVSGDVPPELVGRDDVVVVVTQEEIPMQRPARAPLTRDLIRGRHPQTRAEGEAKVATGFLRTDNPETGTENDLHLALEYGVTDRFSLGFEVGPHPVTRSLLLTAGDNLEHFTATGMYAISSNQKSPLTARLDVILTERQDGTTTDSKVEWRPSVVGGHQINDKSEVYGGIGGAFTDESGKTERLTYSTAYAHRLSRVVVGLVEVDGAIGRQSFHEMYVTPGIVFNARKRVQVRAGVPIGLTRDSAEYQLFLGLSVVF